MEKRAKISKILYKTLCFVYIPVSFFCILAPMASDGTIGSSNPVYITLINTFCIISWLIPLLSIIGMILHHVFLRREQIIRSIIILLLPLTVFLGNLILLAIAESMPSMIGA